MKVGSALRVLNVEPLALPRPLREHGLPPRTTDEENLDIILGVLHAMGKLEDAKQGTSTR